MAGKPWYTNGINEIQVGSNELIPNGYYKGRLPKTQEQKDQSIQKYKQTMSQKSQEELDDINLKRSNSLSNTYQSKSEEEKQQIINKRINTMNNKSDEEKLAYRQKLSDSSKGKNLGKEPWNKNHTKDNDERVAINAMHTSEANQVKAEKIKQENPDYYKEWRKKVAFKMKQNHSYKESSEEKKFYQQLLLKYDELDIIPQYDEDPRYPFACDFYIKSEDKFIELNKNWTHDKHPFNAMDLNDISKLEFWQEEAKTKPYYKNAIYTWTDLDVRKQKIAKENHLNYEVIY